MKHEGAHFSLDTTFAAIADGSSQVIQSENGQLPEAKIRAMITAAEGVPVPE